MGELPHRNALLEGYAPDARKCEWAVYEKALSEGLDDDPVHPLATRLFPPGAA
jgi:hypothetical protein